MFLREFAASRPALRIHVTGMGAANARRGLSEALAGLDELPRAVITSGFAGGLSPRAQANDVLVESPSADLTEAFVSAGAHHARFHCGERVIGTIAEKRSVAERTGADAVEMESGLIMSTCREAGVPCATVRVVLDPADQDLPLDFNLLLNEHFQLSPVKLAAALLKRPAAIPELLRFRQQTRSAAQRLAEVLQAGLRSFLPECK